MQLQAIVHNQRNGDPIESALCSGHYYAVTRCSDRLSEQRVLLSYQMWSFKSQNCACFEYFANCSIQFQPNMLDAISYVR